jgi:hypothetical protein
MTTGIDPRIDNILKKATNANPNLRYPNAGELADDLDNLIPMLGGPQFATTPTVTPILNAGNKVVLASNKEKSGVASFVVILFLLLGGGAAAFYLFGKEDEKPQVGIPEKEAELKSAPEPKKSPRRKPSR